MKRISPERKAVALAKLLPPYNITVTAVAQMEGISEATLYYWRNKAKAEGGKCWSHPPVLHADNGAAMKSQTLQMKLHELSITPSHCRPRVSNDNAYVESLFRTLKYVPQWPSSGFGTLTEAREWVEDFTQWYNETHRHSGIRYVTLRQRHRGEDGELLKRRDEVYQRAKTEHPERWLGRTRNWQLEGAVMLNSEREKQAA